MPKRVNHSSKVQVGDVLMVSRPMWDKDTNEQFTWRYFAVVKKKHSGSVDIYRLGAPDSHTGYSMLMNHPEFTIHLLEPDEWPDGVCALRMKAILEGRLEGIV